MSESPVTTHVASTDGTVYLRTHLAETATQIAEALLPYVGRTMRMDLPNLYGHFHRYWGELRSIDGVVATVHVPGYAYTTEINVMDAFGTHCTMIEKEKD